MGVTASELNAMAMRYLARREYSRAQLEARLLAKGDCESSLLEALLDALEEQGALSDERFAYSYVRSRIARGYGPARIGLELRERGVDTPVAEKALNAGDDGQPWDWFELALNAKRKKYGEAAPADFKERAKWQQFLRYRGFEFEQIELALES